MQYMPILLLLLTGAACGAEGRCTVAAYYFPGYHPDARNDQRLGKGWTEWLLIQSARPRFEGHLQPKRPLWGYEDESDPRAFEKKNAAAADHGVDVFLFDWYWHDQGPFLHRGLDEGFLKSGNRQRMRFALMWANHDWVELFPAQIGKPQTKFYSGGVSRATFDRATQHAITAYFSQPNYWKLDGKPYFSIYELMTLVRGLGGMEQARAALDDFRARARAAGLPGIHLNAVAWGVKPQGLARDEAEMIRLLGIDSVTSYCWIHHNYPRPFPAAPYPQWARQSAGQWDGLSRQFPVPYYPNVSMGWDSSPRTTQSDAFREAGYPYTSVVVGNTPAEFQKALQAAKDWLAKQPVEQRILTINAWNEWTEGSYLEPDESNKFGYLEAIREVFK